MSAKRMWDLVGSGFGGLILLEEPVVRLYWAQKSRYMDLWLGGGYLRDRFLRIYLEMPLSPKDVDLFTFMEPVHPALLEDHDTASVEGSTRVRGVEKIEPSQWREAAWVGDDKILPYDAEIILFNPEYANDVKNAVEKFAFGIQQIWWGGGDIQCTEEFLHDVDRKSLTVTRCEGEVDAGIIYDKYKWLVRYGALEGWRLRVPERWAQFFPSVDHLGHHVTVF